jgi:lactoylglutathione lyase
MKAEHSAAMQSFSRRDTMHFKIVHANLNVIDLDRSVRFYQEALGLKVISRKKAGDGSFELVFLEDGSTGFNLELTWLRDHPQPYELGDNESHICFRTDEYAQAHALHEQMGCICYENTSMGLYFINDPDGYWLEIVPER